MKKQRIAGILSTTLLAGWFFAPALVAQQDNNQASPRQAPETAQQPQQQSQPATAQSGSASPNTAAAPANGNQQAQPQQPATNPGGASVNPSQAPLQPVTTYPDAAGEQQPAATTTPAQTVPTQTVPAQTNVPEAPQPKRQTEPVGAAAAESVPTAGGAAAKPAGVAIAPAKQHQTRSLLLKIGAVVAAGAAVGTIYALSHSTPSTPPGTGIPGAMPR
jgi:hypothetical protein